MPFTPCIGCHVPVPVGTGGRCARCRLPNKRARSSSAWKSASREVRNAGVCAECLQPFPPEQLQAAHRTALADGGAVLGPARALCRHCHQVETRRENGLRAAGRVLYRRPR